MNDKKKVQILSNETLTARAILEGRTEKITAGDVRALLRDLEAKNFTGLSKKELIALALKVMYEEEIVPPELVKEGKKANKHVRAASPLRGGIRAASPRGRGAASPRGRGASSPKGKGKGKTVSKVARYHEAEAEEDEKVRNIALEWIKTTYNYAVPTVIAGALGYLYFNNKLRLSSDGEKWTSDE